MRAQTGTVASPPAGPSSSALWPLTRKNSPGRPASSRLSGGVPGNPVRFACTADGRLLGNSSNRRSKTSKSSTAKPWAKRLTVTVKRLKKPR